MRASLSLLPLIVGCTGEPDFSKYTAFSRDAVCSGDPVSDFLLTEDTPLTQAIEVSDNDLESVTYYGIASRRHLDIYSDVVREEVRGLELAFFEGGNMLVAYRNEDGVQVAGSKDEGEADGFACDDGTIVAQYMTKNLLVVGRCSFDLDPETLEPQEACRGSVYYKCPYDPEVSLRTYEDDCRKLVDFSTPNTPVFCIVNDEDDVASLILCSEL